MAHIFCEWSPNIAFIKMPVFIHPESSQFGQKPLGKIPIFVKYIYKMTFLDEKNLQKNFLFKNWKSYNFLKYKIIAKE